MHAENMAIPDAAYQLLGITANSEGHLPQQAQEWLAELVAHNDQHILSTLHGFGADNYSLQILLFTEQLLIAFVGGPLDVELDGCPKTLNAACM